MATIQERIKELRTEKDFTQEELAKILGLNSKSNIANYESGANSPSDKIKLKMCELFNCTMDYLMGMTNVREPIEGLNTSNLDEKTKKNVYEIYEYIQEQKELDIKKEHKLFIVPILGKITAGQPILAEEHLEGYLPVDPNIYAMTTPDDYFYLKVSGESMNLKIHNGDYALVHKQDYAENGDIVVAIVNGDDEATLKRYKKISDEIIMLEPMSTYSIEPIIINIKETDFKIIGKAIGQFGKF